MGLKQGTKIWLIKLIRERASAGDLSDIVPAKALAEEILETYVTREDHEALIGKLGQLDEEFAFHKNWAAKTIGKLRGKLNSAQTRCVELEEESDRYQARMAEQDQELLRQLRIITSQRSDLICVGKALAVRILKAAGQSVPGEEESDEQSGSEKDGHE